MLARTGTSSGAAIGAALRAASAGRSGSTAARKSAAFAAQIPSSARYNSSSSNAAGNASKGQADAAPPSQQNAEQVGRDAAAELQQNFIEDAPPTLQGQVPAARPARGARGQNRPEYVGRSQQRSGSRNIGPAGAGAANNAAPGGSTSSRLRSIISGSNKGAPSTGHGTASGRGANVAGATSQNRRSRPSMAQAPLQSADGAEPVALEGTADEEELVVDQELYQDLGATLDSDPRNRQSRVRRLSRAQERRSSEPRSQGQQQAGERQPRQRNDQRTRAPTREDGRQAQPRVTTRSQRLQADEEADEAELVEDEAVAEEAVGEEGEEDVEALAPIEQQAAKPTTSAVNKSASRPARRSAQSAAVRRAPTLEEAAAEALGPYAVLPDLTTDWSSELTRTPVAAIAPLTGLGVAHFARPPTVTRFSPGASNDAREMQPIAVPGHLRHKQAAQLLRVSLPPPQVHKAVGHATWEKVMLAAPADTPSNGDADEDLATRVRNARQRKVAENVGGDYTRYLPDAAEAPPTSDNANDPRAVAAQAVALNASLAISAKQFLKDGVAEKLKGMEA